MGLDERLLDSARSAADKITAAQQEVKNARDGFQRAVRALYLDGGSLREIAEALSLSHQRVHQLLGVRSASVVRPHQPATWAPRVRRFGRQVLPCSFCGRHQQEVTKLIAGQGGVAICDSCVALAGTSLDRDGELVYGQQVTVAEQPAPGQCPFCGKHTAVELAADPRSPIRLIIAPGASKPAAICEECLALCEEIIAETTGQTGSERVR